MFIVLHDIQREYSNFLKFYLWFNQSVSCIITSVFNYTQLFKSLGSPRLNLFDQITIKNCIIKFKNSDFKM